MFADDVKTAIKSVLSHAGADLRVRSTLIANLVFLFHTTRASEHLLETAVAVSKDRPELAYYTEHLEEERGHHVWLADDLKLAGVDVAQTAIPRVAVEMVGSQYYLMHHVDPAALLGYMAVLECYPHDVAAIEELEGLHGKELLRTARYHAEHDIGHGQDIEATLNALPESSRLIVLQNAHQTATYIAQAIKAFPKD